MKNRGRGSKAKGSSFERKICIALSLWVSHGKHKDLFWRSAMSGGRSTVAHHCGEHVRQAGDICSVSPEGHSLTDRWYIECKHLKSLRLETFLLQGKGPLKKFWKTACRQAQQYDREPMLIAKQNNGPILVVTLCCALAHEQPFIDPKIRMEHFDITLFDDLMKTKYLP
jgi:hypothetical protein